MGTGSIYTSILHVIITEGLKHNFSASKAKIIVQLLSGYLSTSLNSLKGVIWAIV